MHITNVTGITTENGKTTIEQQTSASDETYTYITVGTDEVDVTIVDADTVIISPKKQ